MSEGEGEWETRNKSVNGRVLCSFVPICIMRMWMHRTECGSALFDGYRNCWCGCVLRLPLYEAPFYGNKSSLSNLIKIIVSLLNVLGRHFVLACMDGSLCILHRLCDATQVKKNVWVHFDKLKLRNATKWFKRLKWMIWIFQIWN